MKIFGKTIAEYLAFQKYPLLFVVIVGLGRLCLSLAGTPNSVARWLSITVASLLVLVYYSVRIHTSGFGSYLQLLPIHFIQSLVAQLIVVAGISIAIFTHKDNVFSAPEFSGGGDGKTWIHAGAHLIIGFTIGPLFGWLLGCALLWVVKRIVPSQSASRAAA